MRTCARTLEPEMSPRELDLLISKAIEAKLPGKHLEVGTAAGGTLCACMAGFREEERPPFVVVDPMSYFPGQLQRVRLNLSQHGIAPDTVDFRVCSSLEAFQSAAIMNERFDWIFIDASHKLRYVAQDLRWASLLNVGGYLSFHDYCSRFPGVRIAVNYFLRRNTNYRVVEQVDSLIILQKMAPSCRSETGLGLRMGAPLASVCLQVVQSLRKRGHKISGSDA